MDLVVSNFIFLMLGSFKITVLEQKKIFVLTFVCIYFLWFPSFLKKNGIFGLELHGSLKFRVSLKKKKKGQRGFNALASINLKWFSENSQLKCDSKLGFHRNYLFLLFRFDRFSGLSWYQMGLFEGHLPFSSVSLSSSSICYNCRAINIKDQ